MLFRHAHSRLSPRQPKDNVVADGPWKTSNILFFWSEMARFSSPQNNQNVVSSYVRQAYLYANQSTQLQGNADVRQAKQEHGVTVVQLESIGLVASMLESVAESNGP
jgi:hypothetical protein